MGDQKGLKYIPYQKKGNKFVNPHLQDTKRKVFDFLKWQLGLYEKGKEPALVPDGFQYPNPQNPYNPSKPMVMWINHCSFFGSCNGVNFLTDPIWSHRCSPLKKIGPPRQHAPALELEDLPHLSFVIVSHNHYDHLDRNTILKLHKLQPHIHYIMPTGVGKWFRKRGIRNISEFHWWEKKKIALAGGKTIDVTAVPTQHFSGRGLFDKDKSLWAGFVIDFNASSEEHKRFYFVGDTGYNEHDFKLIGDHFGKMDLSLIPIGTYIPHEFMDPVHIDPHKACRIHQEVNSNLSVGMHWKTFKLSEEELHQPPYDLYLTMMDHGLSPLNFRIIEPGQIINW